MKFNIFQVKLDKSAGPFGRALQFALYDWTRDMPADRRWLTMFGFVIQVGALVIIILSGQSKPFIFLALLLYIAGLCLLNGMLTSEFVRKTQLEADQIAAEQIQRTLQPSYHSLNVRCSGYRYFKRTSITWSVAAPATSTMPE